MAEISPVRDPNFENFNYGQQLSTATDPIRAIGAGRLAIAQQRNQQAFESQQRQQEQIAMGQRQHANLQQQEDIRQQEEERHLNMGAQTLYRQVQQTHPEATWDSNKSREENVAALQETQKQDRLDGLQASVDAQNAALNEYQQKQRNASNLRQPTDSVVQQLVTQKLINDPALTTSAGNWTTEKTLGPLEIQKLQGYTETKPDGTKVVHQPMTPEQLAATFNTATEQKKLIDAANAARATILPALQAKDQADFATFGNVLSSRVNFHNQAIQSQLQGFQNDPDMMARAAKIISAAQPVSSATPALDASGNLAALTGAGTTKTTDNAKTSGTGTDVAVPAGTPATLNQNVYTHKAALDAVNESLASEQAWNDRLNASLKAGTTMSKGSYLPVGGGPFGSGVGPDPSQFGPIPMSVQEKGDLAKQIIASNAKLAKLKEEAGVHNKAIGQIDPQNTLGYLPQLPQTNSVQPVVQSPGAPPLTTPTGAPASSSPPLVQPSPTNAPVAQPGAPNGAQTMNNQAAMTALLRTIGITDPNELPKVRQFAITTLGKTPEYLQGLIAAVGKQDPQAIQTAQQIVQQSRQQGGVPTPTGGFDPSALNVPNVGSGAAFQPASALTTQSSLP